jgi:uncharacterized phage-associated protein
MVNIFDVARYILHAIGGDISTMKLQKLCYYCQAWHLAWKGEPLFQEDFRRWNNGPVCRELYDVHKKCFTISEEIIPCNLFSCDFVDDYVSAIIDRILEDYGKFDGAQLSEITHEEDPWKNTKANEIIDKKLIELYYKSVDDENEQKGR